MKINPWTGKQCPMEPSRNIAKGGRLDTADKYIATLESQAVAVSVSATIVRMEKKAAYLKAREPK